MLYPLKFQPIYKAKVWGGRALASRLGRELPDGDIGESWELADLASTSASGGGGDAARSVVVNGPHAGRTLHELIDVFGAAVHGTVPLTDTGDFPLLVKYLDANDNLSMQVHPSVEYAASHADAHLKSEAWYIVHAEPGAAIYKGVSPGVTPEMLRDAITNNTVENLMIRVPVQPGECHYLPSGTCHALGAGLLVAEVQTPSDTTFRVYDWGRTGRELHIEQALRCIHFGPVDTSAFEPGTLLQRERTTVRALVHCEHFRIERLDVVAGHGMPIVLNHQPRVWMVLDGRLRITSRDNDAPTEVHEVYAGAGDTLLLPAAMHHPLVTAESEATVLDVTFPQAMAQVIA